MKLVGVCVTGVLDAEKRNGGAWRNVLNEH
jgi:hypothetical protein